MKREIGKWFLDIAKYIVTASKRSSNKKKGKGKRK